jgi:hypothetical protein
MIYAETISTKCIHIILFHIKYILYILLLILFRYKLCLADILIETLNPIREKIQQYMNEPNYLQKVLQEGTKKAEAKAFKNWLEVRDKVGYGTNKLPNNELHHLQQICN